MRASVCLVGSCSLGWVGCREDAATYYDYVGASLLNSRAGCHVLLADQLVRLFNAVKEYSRTSVNRQIYWHLYSPR